MGVGDSTQLFLRGTTQRLQEEGHSNALPERVRRILNSVAADGRGDGGSGGSLSVRGRDSDTSAGDAEAGVGRAVAHRGGQASRCRQAP